MSENGAATETSKFNVQYTVDHEPVFSKKTLMSCSVSQKLYDLLSGPSVIAQIEILSAGISKLVVSDEDGGSKTEYTVVSTPTKNVAMVRGTNAELKEVGLISKRLVVLDENEVEQVLSSSFDENSTDQYRSLFDYVTRISDEFGKLKRSYESAEKGSKQRKALKDEIKSKFKEIEKEYSPKRKKLEQLQITFEEKLVKHCANYQQ